jgi:ferric-dicitrate binding protein FerR (iron transport regulator)
MTHSLLVRGASFALSVSLLLPALAAAAGSAPLGTLRSEGAVYVDSSLVPAQSSLFSGDRVATADGRASISLAHGSSVLLDRASSVALSNTLTGLRVGLVKGRVTFNTNPRAPIQVETAGLTVVAAGQFPSLAEVAMLADGSVSLAVHRGSMLVRSAGEESAVVTAGKAITVGPQAVRKAQTPGTAAHGGKTVGQAAQGVHLSHGASMVLIGAVVVATAAAIAIPIAVSDDETPVSPAVP